MAHVIGPAAVLSIVLCCVRAGGAMAATLCPTQGDTMGRIAAVEPRLELRLADGQVLRLAGLDPPLQTPRDPELGDAARRRLSADLTGKEVKLRRLAATPDRWGRVPAMVFTADDETTGGGLVTLLLAEGLGRYLAEPDAGACRDVWIAAETKARAAKLGLWADPYYAVLTVDDHDGFMERSGTIVLAEGQLAAVVPGPYRTILRFAVPTSRRAGEDPSGRHSYGGHMLVATILPRTMKTFEARRVDVRSWIGRRLRLRGLLDLRFGPRIELAGPDDVEPIDEVPSAAIPPHAN